MASAYAHLSIAEYTLSSSEKTAGAAGDNSALFYLGAQGADFAFFCGKRGGENIGRSIHRGRIYSDFLSLSRFCVKNEKALPWCLGMCSHYAADAVFHGYIYSVLAAEGGGSKKHAAIERAMDRAFSAFNGKELSYSFLKPEKADAEIIASAVNVIRPKARFSGADVERGFKRFRFYLNKISPLFIYRPREEEKAAWFSLYKNAVELSVKVCEEFILSLKRGSLGKEFFILNYLGQKI